MKKNLIGFIGFVLVVGTLIGGLDRITALLDWSTSEMAGYNIGTLAFLIGGGWMVRYSMKKNESSLPTLSKDSQEVS